MNLFEVALDYAQRRSPGWGRLLVCLRSDAGFGYRVHNDVPVISLPRVEADTSNLSLLAYLFGRHAVRSGDGACAEPWQEAEAIYSELCDLAQVPFDSQVIQQQRSKSAGPLDQPPIRPPARPQSG